MQAEKASGKTRALFVMRGRRWVDVTYKCRVCVFRQREVSIPYCPFPVCIYRFEWKSTTFKEDKEEIEENASESEASI